MNKTYVEIFGYLFLIQISTFSALLIAE